jgi:DNA anti-recombination protein RmuC
MKEPILNKQDGDDLQILCQAVILMRDIDELSEVYKSLANYISKTVQKELAKLNAHQRQQYVEPMNELLNWLKEQIRLAKKQTSELNASNSQQMDEYYFAQGEHNAFSAIYDKVLEDFEDSLQHK